MSCMFFHKIARKSFEKEIDEFFNNKDLIKRFGGTSAIKPYKAFVKKFEACLMRLIGIY